MKEKFIKPQINVLLSVVIATLTESLKKKAPM